MAASVALMARVTVVDALVLLTLADRGCLNMLARSPARRFIIPAEVEHALCHNQVALAAAVRMCRIERVTYALGDDAALFGRLTQRLSVAEAACILVTRVLRADLTTDDPLCRAAAYEVLPSTLVLSSTNLIAEAFGGDMLDHDASGVTGDPGVAGVDLALTTRERVRGHHSRRMPAAEDRFR